VAVLGASSYIYAEATRSQELLHWVTAHVHAFEYMGGCPAVVVSDNLRSGVNRPHRYEPDVNATYSVSAVT
jgi:transposase